MLTIVNLSWQTTEVGIQETTVPPYGERGISERYVRHTAARSNNNKPAPPSPQTEDN